MITLVEKKPLIFKIRVSLSKFLVNRKIKYASKRGASSVEITYLNDIVKKELMNYYQDKGFSVWGGGNDLSANVKIEWLLLKEDSK